jgi:hypothetical protein
MNLRSLILFSLLSTQVGACATFHMNTPDGFAELDDTDDYGYRAVNAEGIVVAVRSERNRPEGNLDFWARSLDERLRSQGYSPDGEARPVQNASGLRGLQFRYVRDVGGRPLRYWVTVFVRDGGFLRRARVYVIEAGGDREVFDRAVPSVERAIQQFST